MLTTLTGFSQFVINILLPYTNTETRLLITSVIDQFALIFEAMEILLVFRFTICDLKSA